MLHYHVTTAPMYYTFAAAAAPARATAPTGGTLRSNARAAAPQRIVYTLTVPIGTHDFDKNLSAPPAGYPTVHVAVVCVVGSKLTFSATGISGNVLAQATGMGTSYGREFGNVALDVVVTPNVSTRLLAIAKPTFLCSFVSGPIRDITGVVITPRNITGSVSGTLPIPPAPHSEKRPSK